MKILLLAPQPFFQHRGTPIAVRALANTLGAAGHHIDLLTFHEGEDIEIPNCRIHRIPALPGLSGLRPGFSLKKIACDLLMVRACVRLLRHGRFDLIHAVEESAFIALFVRRAFGIPYIFDMDSSLSEQLIDRFRPLHVARSILESLERLAVTRSFAVLAVCRSLEERARRWAPDKLVGRVEDMSLLEMEGAAATQDFREVLGIAGPIAMYVGNLEPYQGIDLLLESFARAAHEVPDAALVVVGGSPGAIRRYQRRSKRLGIANSAHFVGPRPISMLGSCLRQADVLVSPRIAGGNTPMKVYSYLDSGRPVLATNLPTHAQVLDDEISCLASPEPVEFGRALVRLLRDQNRRTLLASRARDRVRAEYSPESFRRKVLSFYAALESDLHTARA